MAEALPDAQSAVPHTATAPMRPDLIFVIGVPPSSHHCIFELPQCFLTVGESPIHLLFSLPYFVPPGNSGRGSLRGGRKARQDEHDLLIPDGTRCASAPRSLPVSARTKNPPGPTMQERP